MAAAVQLTLRCRPFAEFFEIVRQACASPVEAKSCDQARYIESYLRNREPRAKTILVEHPYVDRHWIEEYTGYYARLLYPPPSHTTRLHFFSEALTTESFHGLLGRATRGVGSVERDLEAIYLGFSVIRPLPCAPIGRTILRPYVGDENRCYEPARMVSRVHLAGMELKVEGLPFQQQDVGVGACATAALWSALTKVMRTDGQRPHTPLEITTSATESRVVARAFPASAGLDLDQMAAAIRSAGYEPHVFGTGGEEELFLLALTCYLRSGIPVVARVYGGECQDYHAMTLVGFREHPPAEDDEGIVCRIKSRALRAPGVIRFYVHDDRFGPYARLSYKLEKGEHGESRVLRLEPTESGYDDLMEPMHFIHALVPLYPKLRLTAEDLIEFALDILPLVDFLAGEQGRDCLALKARFCLGGQYLKSALSYPIDPDRLVGLCSSALLSRYVGVLSFELSGEWFCDVVYDTTDLRRDHEGVPPPVLVALPRDPRIITDLDKFRSSRLGDKALVV